MKTCNKNNMIRHLALDEIGGRGRINWSFLVSAASDIGPDGLPTNDCLLGRIEFSLDMLSMCGATTPVDHLRVRAYTDAREAARSLHRAFAAISKESATSLDIMDMRMVDVIGKSKFDEKYIRVSTTYCTSVYVALLAYYVKLLDVIDLEIDEALLLDTMVGAADDSQEFKYILSIVGVLVYVLQEGEINSILPEVAAYN